MFGASTLAILQILEAAATDGPLVVSFIQNAVSAVEATDKSGTDKLTAVLNAVEAFIDQVAPAVADKIDAFMAAVEAFVSDLVALYNEAGVFIKAVKSAV